MTTARPTAPEAPETLEALLGDCRLMAHHWKVPAAGPRGITVPAPSPAAGPRGITVPAATAHAIRLMGDYGS